MWIFVFFDLPTNTANERRAASLFRKSLIKDGFNMLQYSVYIRHCDSSENAAVHVKRVKNILPLHGIVNIIQLTDKQFGNMESYSNASETKNPDGGEQLTLF